MNNYKYAIFLGAGASAAEGAPVQNKLFKSYFKLKIKDSEKERRRIKEELEQFFLAIFNIDFKYGKIGKSAFPTFEEAIGILDLLGTRKESLQPIGT
jgi:hypothetical protein